MWALAADPVVNHREHPCGKLHGRYRLVGQSFPMSFEDLPPNWTSLPIETPGLAGDLVDLTVGIASREAGCVALIVTTPDGRPGTPMLVDEVPEDADPQRFGEFLETLLPTLRQTGAGLVFARGRLGGVLLTDTDRRWHQMVFQACAAHGVRLVGAYLATPVTVRSFPEPLSIEHLAS